MLLWPLMLLFEGKTTKYKETEKILQKVLLNGPKAVFLPNKVSCLVLFELGATNCVSRDEAPEQRSMCTVTVLTVQFNMETTGCRSADLLISTIQEMLFCTDIPPSYIFTGFAHVKPCGGFK